MMMFKSVKRGDNMFTLWRYVGHRMVNPRLEVVNTVVIGEESYNETVWGKNSLGETSSLPKE